MRGKNIFFGDKKIKKSNFFKSKKIFDNIDEINVDKILVSEKESYGTNKSFKHFFGYNGYDNINPFLIKRPQGTSYVKHFSDNIVISFKAIDNSFSKKKLQLNR